MSLSQWTKTLQRPPSGHHRHRVLCAYIIARDIPVATLITSSFLAQTNHGYLNIRQSTRQCLHLGSSNWRPPEDAVATRNSHCPSNAVGITRGCTTSPTKARGRSNKSGHSRHKRHTTVSQKEANTSRRYGLQSSDGIRMEVDHRVQQTGRQCPTTGSGCIPTIEEMRMRHSRLE